MFVDAAEGDLLPDDHDHAGVAGPALHPDWFGGGAWRGPRWAGATQPFDLLRGEGVLAGAEQLAGGQVVEHQRGGLDPDADPPAAEDLSGEQAAARQADQAAAGNGRSTSTAGVPSDGGSGRDRPVPLPGR